MLELCFDPPNHSADKHDNDFFVAQDLAYFLHFFSREISENMKISVSPARELDFQDLLPHSLHLVHLQSVLSFACFAPTE